MPATPAMLRLTENEAACLAAARAHKHGLSAIAIHGKVTLAQASAALRTLGELELTSRDQEGAWHLTAKGRTCRFETIEKAPRRIRRVPIDHRLLKMLDRPMSTPQLRVKLNISPQLLRMVLVRLHARGDLVFCDPDCPTWLVKRPDDRTPVLSREEERVLSAVPADYATDADRIAVAAGIARTDIPRVLAALTSGQFVEAEKGLRGERVYRLTTRGADHSQRKPDARDAPAPRLPVGSDRVRNALATIERFGAIGIKRLSVELGVEHQSINGLVQYLKRKGLLQKSGSDRMAPYGLTNAGRFTLSEMTRRLAA